MPKPPLTNCRRRLTGPPFRSSILDWKYGIPDLTLELTSLKHWLRTTINTVMVTLGGVKVAR